MKNDKPSLYQDEMELTEVQAYDQLNLNMLEPSKISNIQTISNDLLDEDHLLQSGQTSKRGAKYKYLEQISNKNHVP